MKTSFTVPTAIILGGILIAGALYVSLAGWPKTGTGDGNPALVRPVGVNDHIFGNPLAPIMIITYSDFDSKYSRSFQDSLRQVIESEGASGRVSIVFRHFPLTELHPNAMQHAQAAECVAKVTPADHTIFWKFADALFARQPVDPTRYGEIAASVGVPAKAFTSCFTNAATEVDARIIADRQNALDVGAHGAPHSLIVVQGKPPIVMTGAYTADAIQLLIDQALSELPSSTSSSR